MGRYTGPVCRLCRREGKKLFLKGARCYSAHCSMDREGSSRVPGMHGAKRARKLSDYGVQLREKQRLRRQYGLQEGQFRRVYEEAIRRQGVTGEIMLQLLEMRLDNLVFRMGFAASRANARQFVRHNHVLVNGRKANIPSMTLKVGDVVQVRDRDKDRNPAAAAFGAISDRQRPEWLKIDDKAFSCEIISLPTREQIAADVDEQLVVELYSR